MKLDQYFSHWQQIRADLLMTIDKFNDQELDFVPYDGSWSVGQIIRHIVGAEVGWFHYVVSNELTDWPEYPIEEFTTIAAHKTLLNDVQAQTQTLLASYDITDLDQVVEAPWGSQFKLGWIIWHVLEHEIHHRGELSLILGLLGREGLDV